MKKIILPILLIISGCSSTKGYSGPALPADKVANIHISADGPMRITERFVNGVKVEGSTYAFDYPAGSFKVGASYTAEKSNHCTDINNCIVKVVQGKCEGNIVTKGGRNYVVRLYNKSDVVTGIVAARGFYDFTVRPDEANIGTINCKESKV